MKTILGITIMGIPFYVFFAWIWLNDGFVVAIKIFVSVITIVSFTLLFLVIGFKVMGFKF